MVSWLGTVIWRENGSFTLFHLIETPQSALIRQLKVSFGTCLFDKIKLQRLFFNMQP